MTSVERLAGCRRAIIGAFCLATLSACASSPPSDTSYWNQSAQKVIATTCGGTVYDGSTILGYPPESVFGRCYLIRGPLEISDWITGESALVNGNKLRIDNVMSYDSNIVPGGLFLGEAPFTYQDLEGKWSNVMHLRNLGVRLAQEK